MNLFSAAVAIVAILSIVSIAQKWIEARRRDAHADPEMDHKLKDLRERIETLERIVTDQRETLRRKFDEL
ncbi:MAG: hypothetical protein EA419_04585 [Wenzhouxiangella sp.]|nr:MAG: hypothetical protein EA419_04585 [Wenzhouxiangella sp.]